MFLVNWNDEVRAHWCAVLIKLEEMVTEEAAYLEPGTRDTRRS
jgi:hypothetical protein